MSHVFRKRFVRTSVRWRPLRHSTRTAEGTIGGQNPSRFSAVIIAAASWLWRDRRVTPPESSTSKLKRRWVQRRAVESAV